MRSFLVRVGLLSLLVVPAWAQQPVLPSVPQPAASPSPSGTVPTTLPVAPTVSPASSGTEIIGLVYSVELRSGTTFLGTLRAANDQELTFDTKDLGSVTVQRANLRQLIVLTPAQAHRGYYDVGNGSRLLLGPTARNLRQGEGYAQNIDVFLLGVNYGITNNFSIGALFTFVPSAGSDNFFALTPKVSFPVNENLHLGVGALLGITRGGTFGVTYANGTLGSADHNLTLGLGYGFSNGSFSSTPVFVLGGATRISRRVSLLNETYYFRTSDGYYKENNFAGIAGIRIAAQRLSGSLGLLYNYYSEEYNGNSYGYYGSSSYSHFDAIPYAEVAYRFGRIR